MASWNWTEFCPTGLTPFLPNSNDLLPCFQEILLQLPIYTIFSAISSYNYGIVHRPVVRNLLQLKLIYIRTLVSMILSIIPISKLIYFKINEIDITPADLLTGCTECIMWIIHAGFLLSLRKQGELSHRGPLIINVMWTSIFVSNIIWLRTSIRFPYLLPWSLLKIVFNSIYLLSFIPKGKALYARIQMEPEETQTLLPNHRYVHFNFEVNEMSLGHAQDEANFASRMLFYWVEPLIAKGVAGNLKKIEDLFDLPDCLNIQRISDKLHAAFSLSTSSLIWGLHKSFAKEFYSIGILRFIADMSGFAGPLLLGGLLSEHSEASSGTDVKPYYYAVGLFIATLISAFCGIHFNWRISIIAMKMRTGIVNAIYRKSLEAQGLQDSKPEILNLMSTDTDRIVNSCISFHSFWSIPFQLFTTLYLLYTQVGAAFIAGLCFAATLIPINRYLAKKIQIYSIGLMKAKDERLGVTSETISGIKQVKLHALEDLFINKIKQSRAKEIVYLKKRKYLDALCVYFWATTPVMMSLLTFGVSVLMGNPLTASTTYTSVALLNMLIGPLNAFPWVLNGLVEAWVSVKRVQELLNIKNLDFATYYNPIVPKHSPSTLSDDAQYILQIKDATFTYDVLEKQETDYIYKLEDINLNLKKNDLICIESTVGTGKTTLISGIIAGINCSTGSVCIEDLNSGFGYVSQQPWLQRGTIKDNIIWGSIFDEQRYKNVLYACCLLDDLEILGGDNIGIGENGRTLSGGQRMRVALARAVYQEKKIYLLDDILSCVDAHVANHIIKYCILGLLKDKARIIITENRSLFFHANQILTIQNGTLQKSIFMSESFELSDDGLGDEMNDYFFSTVNIFNNIDKKKPSSNNDDTESVDSVLLEENKQYGYLDKNVLLTYLKAMTGIVGFFVILFVVLMQISRNLCDIWLAHWVTVMNPTNLSSNYSNLIVNENVIDSNDSNRTIDNDLTYYLGVYTGLTILNSVITLIRAFIFAAAGIKAAQIINIKLMLSVIYTKFYFFDITSVGRILNRFSSDTYTIDDSLPFILNILLAQFVGLIGALLVSLIAMPWLSLVMIPLIPIYLNLQYRYRYSSRDIKRLSSNALSPLYTHFTETLQGLTTIRAMRAAPRFQRDFNVKLEESIKAQLTSSAAQQWLSIRLQFLGCVLVGGAGLLSAITSSHATNPSLVGLTISYALSVTSLLSGVLNAFAETEQEMVAVERVSQYLELEEEKNYNGTADPPFGWPLQGAVTFKNMCFRYRDHLKPVLINFHLKTEAYERIAIVGRTGAGKSSILAALLRIAPVISGEITVDCVNLKTLSLRVLRDRIVIIPQEPFLFEGTIRENLDPQRHYLDSELWNAITNCLATPLVQSLGGLNGYLERGGNNLSAGQKQLLCLTRALLKNSKVVCIDEGTSNLDSDSEAAIQIALRNSFKCSTILFIAHRLKGLQYMDRIIVMDAGQIVEMGSPNDLANNVNSKFAKMLQEQRNKDYN